MSARSGGCRHTVDAEVNGAFEALLAGLVRENPVLGKGGHLDRDEVGQFVADTEEAAHHRVVVAGDVRVRADEQRPLGTWRRSGRGRASAARTGSGIATS